MLLRITHKTQYSYSQPVDYALQKVRLTPRSSAIQDISDWEVTVDGGQVEASYSDHYGNHVDLVSIEQGAQNLTVTATGTANTQDTAGVFGKVYGRAPLWHFQQSTPLTTPASSMASLAAILEEHDTQLAGLHALSAAILSVTPYQVGATNSETTAAAALALGAGVCQDHAHIFITAARIAGLPARYVSGYLMMDDRVDQDASHAWAEAHVDGVGWVGFDVSNGISPDERYVRIAIGRDAQDAAPISGLRMGQSDEAMIVSLQVQQ